MPVTATTAGTSAVRPMPTPAAPTMISVRWIVTQRSGGAGADQVTVSISDTPLIARTTPPARKRCSGSQRPWSPLRPAAAAKKPGRT